MTSEEALMILFASNNYNGNYQELIEANEKLEKDLEVLKILKKVFNYKSVQKFIEEISVDEFFILKEWLGNDSN